MHMKNEEKTPKKKSQDKRGYYVALAICAAAIGIAAWSTYDTMSGFLEPADTSAENSAESAGSASEASAAEDDPEATVSEGHAPVSYTHLDVYKRQYRYSRFLLRYARGLHQGRPCSAERHRSLSAFDP